MVQTTRRQLLQYGLAAGAALAMPVTRRELAGTFRDSDRALGASRLAKFRARLPVPGHGLVVAAPSGANRYAFTQRAIRRRLHPDLPPTRLWAYDDGSGLAGQAGSFGMVLVAQSGTPLHVSYTNQLPNIYPSWIPVDPRLTHGNGRRVRRSPTSTAASSPRTTTATPQPTAPASLPARLSTPTTATNGRRCRHRCAGFTTTEWAPPG
jgi:hypothetical protein